jgi:hypothetical protein
MYEGKQPQGATVKLSGQAEQFVGPLHLDEEVFFVVRGHVQKVSHQDGKINGAELFIREHTVKASNVVILTPEDGERMLDEATMLAEEAFGIQRMFKQAGVDPETGEVAE